MHCQGLAFLVPSLPTLSDPTTLGHLNNMRYQHSKALIARFQAARSQRRYYYESSSHPASTTCIPSHCGGRLLQTPDDHTRLCGQSRLFRNAVEFTSRCETPNDMDCNSSKLGELTISLNLESIDVISPHARPGLSLVVPLLLQ